MSNPPSRTDALQGFSRKFRAILGLCFVLIMVALDQTVIGTALPKIAAELNGFDLYAWAGTAYLLTSIITIPIFGKLGDEHGRKPFVLAAIVLFTAASMLCGLAHTMPQLIAARALQGVGGGMLVATTFASIPDMFPEARERLRWQILFSGSFGLANAVGPSLGGFITEYWGWRWVFFVNLPVGLASLWFVQRYLPRIRHGAGTPSQLDWLGALLVALALGSLQLLVEWLPQHKPLTLLLGLLAVGGGSALALVWWERRCANPVLPLAILGHARLKPMFILSLVMGFCMFAVMYYVPLLFQGGFGLSPNEAGLLITPLAVSIPLGSLINGRIIIRLPSPNLMLYVGLACFWIAALGLARTDAATSHILIVVIMALAGIGLGMILPNLTLFAQHSAPRTQLGVTTAMLQSTRMIGGMLGMALIGTLVSQRYTHGVNAMLQAGGNDRWMPWLDDPQILVNHDLAQKFAAAAGPDALALLGKAQSSLVSAIHESQWLVAIIAILALWAVRRVPPVNLTHSPSHPESRP